MLDWMNADRSAGLPGDPGRRPGVILSKQPFEDTSQDTIAGPKIAADIFIDLAEKTRQRRPQRPERASARPF